MLTPRRVTGTAVHLYKDFYAVTAISNFQRYRSRYKLYHNFAAHMQATGAKLFTVELALGQREWALPDPDGPDGFQHMRLRTTHELWHKEALLNRAIENLPQDWK